MPFNLKNLSLNEVSLVDNPANPGASVVLWKKRDNGVPTKATEQGDDLMDIEELKKELKAQGIDVSELTKRADAADASTEALQKFTDKVTELAKDAGFDLKVEEDEVTLVKHEAPEMIDLNGEAVEKSSIPAPVLKMLEDQAKDLEVLKLHNESVELAKRADKELPNLAGSAEARGKLLKAIDGMSDEDSKSITEALKAADAAVKQFTVEKGENTPDESSPSARLDKMATDYAAEKNMTFHSAFAEVIKSKEGMDLYEEMSRTQN